MAEFKTTQQSNLAWGESFNMAVKAPAVAKRIWATKADAQAYIDDPASSAVAGLVLAVINDGVYFVKSIGDGENAGLLIRLGADSQAELGDLITKVNTLIGEDANKSVRSIAAEEIAAQLIPEGANEALDTLQEIAAWIQAHPGDVATMNAAIQAAQADATQALADAAAADTKAGNAADAAATADGKAVAAQTAAEAAQSAADKAQEDANALKAIVGSEETTDEQGVTTPASGLVAAVATAQSTADKAVSDAAEAKSAADDAQADATQALSDASDAKDAADAAQADVDALELIIGKASTDDEEGTGLIKDIEDLKANIAHPIKSVVTDAANGVQLSLSDDKALSVALKVDADSALSFNDDKELTLVWMED